MNGENLLEQLDVAIRRAKKAEAENEQLRTGLRRSAQALLDGAAENARLRAVAEAARRLIRTNTTTDGPISLVAEVDHPAFQRLADALTALDVSGEGATDDDDAPFLRQHLAAAEAELHRTRAAQYTAEAERDRLRAVMEANPEALARRFHETYEALAPRFGYETRRESAVPWDQVPENNRRLMVAVCAALLDVSGDIGEVEP